MHGIVSGGDGMMVVKPKKYDLKKQHTYTERVRDRKKVSFFFARMFVHVVYPVM